jgi:hypothetical protein
METSVATRLRVMLAQVIRMKFRPEYKLTPCFSNCMRLLLSVGACAVLLCACRHSDPKLDREARYVGDILTLVSIKRRIDTNLCQKLDTTQLYLSIKGDPAATNILAKVPRWSQSERFIDALGNDYRVVFVGDRPPDAMLFVVLASSNSPPLGHTRTNILWIH